jgi:hypothetical protein
MGLSILTSEVEVPMVTILDGNISYVIISK